ncbi:conserved hypothetical protein [Maribacter litoralis]|uniref:Uncharacterized protein n=1 Tax=Maribacter litoralis TaxID=2059726 RepID=A0A653X9X4_9FLAO|nr:conserved hypothetical protein [Maribacter litoralis]
MVDPIEKNTPCAKPVTTLDNSNNSKLGEIAAKPLPIINSNIIPISNCFLGILPVKAVKMGAPMATPMAYRLTNNPADVNDVPRSFATVDNKPTITNSVVPMANALMVNAHNAAGRLFFLATVWEPCIVVVFIVHCI